MTDIYKKTAEEFVEYAKKHAKVDVETDYALHDRYNAIVAAVDVEASGFDILERAVIYEASRRFDGTERIEGNRRWHYLLSPKEQRRLRWAKYAAAARTENTSLAAELADKLLQEEEKRFGRDE